MTILLVVVILFALIVVHELGHFLAAKLFGVRVDEFGIGYPPRAFTFGKWGGTEYTLNWVPFGGFVRLFGEDESEVRAPGSLANAKRWKQAIILVAGVSMNAIAAWMLFSGALALGTARIVDHAEAGVPVHLVVSDVMPGSPAEAAGMVAGDEILAVSDEDGAVPASLTPDALIAFISAHGGEPVMMRLMHMSTTTNITVTPAHAVVSQDASRPAIGAGLVLISQVTLSPWQAMKEGLTVSTVNAFEAVGGGLWKIVSDAVRGHSDIKQIVGPVGLVSSVGEASRNGIGALFTLAGLISVNLAIINLVPLPVLDGGRLVVIAVEALIRRPLPRAFLQIINTIGVALLILLMVAVTYHDIARLLA